MSLSEEIRDVCEAIRVEIGEATIDVESQLRDVRQEVQELQRRYETAKIRERREVSVSKKPDLRQALLLLADLVTVLGG